MITFYDILQFIAWINVLSFVAVLAFVWWLVFRLAKPENRWRAGVVWTVILLLVAFVPEAKKAYQRYQINEQRRAAYEEAKAVFDHLCATEGKEEIFHTAENVEGITLLNVWGENIKNYENYSNERVKSTWEYAGLPNHTAEGGYIDSFMRWHVAETGSNPNSRWTYYSFSVHKNHLLKQLNNLKGKNIFYIVTTPYNFVDVKNTDKTYNRYFLQDSYDDPLVLLETTDKPFRYAVRFENPIIMEERKYWVARTIATITDLETDTVMAKKTWFSFESRLGERGYDGYMMWSTVKTCPLTPEDHYEGDSIFHFTRKVLKPIENIYHEN